MSTRSISLAGMTIVIILLAAAPAAFAQRPYGVDVSHWESPIDWSQVAAAGYEFAFTKATESPYYYDPPTCGTSSWYYDSTFEYNMVNARNAGVLIGCYHFCHPQCFTASYEANGFVSRAGTYISPGYLRPVLDLEDGESLTTAALSTWVNAWLDSVEAQTGVEPLIYTNPSYALYDLDSTVASRDLWMADPCTSCDPQVGGPSPLGVFSTWKFWQYSWVGSVPGIPGAVDLNVFNGLSAGLQAYVIQSNTSPPTITLHPSDQTVALSGSTSFTTGATGATPLSYQWQKNQVNLTNGGHYSGCATSTLQISNAGYEDEAYYRCVVTNAYGNATTNEAALTVITCVYPSLLNGSFEGGNTSGVATSWTGYQRATNPSTAWSIQTASPPAGAGSQYQQIANTSATGGGGVRQEITSCVAGTTYTISGWMRTNSTSATCTVKCSPTASTDWSTAINLSPAQTTTSSTWVAFTGTVVATGSSMTLWLDGHTGGSGLNKTACFDGVTVTGCGSSAGPNITQQPAAQSICSGANASFTVAATGEGTLTYQWQKNQVNLTNGGHYSGCTTATLAVTGADSNDVANYRCVVTDNNGSTNSSEAGLALKAATTITGQPSNQSVAAGGTANFTVSATGDGTLTYQWQKNSVNMTNGGHYSGCATATLTVSSADGNDAASYRCVVTGGCGSATSNAATLTVSSCATPTLLNGSFEGGNTSGVATSWTGYQRATNPTTVWSIQTASPPSGAGTQYQQIANTTATGGGGVRQNITGCTVGASYTIAGWMRTNSASATCTVKCSPTASTTWSTAANLTPAQTTTSSSWVPFSGSITATGTSMTIWLDGHTGGTGLNKATCFDGVTVTCTP